MVAYRTSYVYSVELVCNDIRQSGAILNGGAIPKGQIFSKLHELMSSILKDL